MSYTQHTATATCTYDKVLDLSDLLSKLYYRMLLEVSSKDNIPTDLLNTSQEEFADIVESYTSLCGNEIEVILDTEEANNDTEIFEYVTGHLIEIMTSKFMKEVWVSYDSREGLSANTIYYDKTGKIIDVEAMLNSR